MSTIVFLVLFAATTSFTFVTADTQPEKYTRNLKVEYFKDVEMQCDHINLNISQKDVVKLQWLFPDGTLRDSSTYLNQEMYQFASINDTSEHPLLGFTLKAFKVNDDMFGYYTCVVVIQSSSNTGGCTVVAIRWGLNVNGADFSELMETYKENAIVGGIAAGVALSLIGFGWLIWFYCFNKDERYLEDGVMKEDERVAATKNSIEMHENAAYAIEKDEKQSAKTVTTGTASQSGIVQF